METLWSMGLSQVSIHQVMLFVQLIALLCYYLTLIAVMAYFSISRKRTTAQAQAIIASNLEKAIDTAVRWSVGICAAVLIVYIVMWFFGSAVTQQTAVECLEILLVLWMASGALSFSMTVFLGMAMRSAKECALFCKKARALPIRLLLMSLLTLCMVAFIRY